MRSLASLLLIFSLLAEQGGNALPPEPAKIGAFLDKCETARRGAILQLEHRLRGLKSGQQRVTHTQREIAKAEENLRVLRANEQPVVPTLAFPPEVGAIGRLPRLSCHLDQIVSDDTILVRCFFPVKIQAVRKYESRRETVTQDVSLTITGITTRDLQEGADIPLQDILEITQQRVTPTGPHWTAKVFNLQTVEPYFRARRQQNANLNEPRSPAR